MSLVYVPKNLSALAAICGDAASRYALSGVRVIDLEDGRYRLEVTDGRRLAVVHGQSLLPEQGAQETIAALRDAPNGATSALIPAADWKSALKMGGKKIDRVGVALGADGIVLACGEQVLNAKSMEGRFPDFRTILPRARPLVRFVVNPSLLAGLLQLAAALGVEGGVTVLWYGPGIPIGIMGKNDQDQYLDCLLMPLT